MDIEGKPTPIEVKSGQSSKKKSLTIYCEKYSTNIAVRTSPLNIAYNGVLLNIPLYAIAELQRLAALRAK